jgi:tetratricopeptide (TPR) repeat protein
MTTSMTSSSPPLTTSPRGDGVPEPPEDPPGSGPSGLYPRAQDALSSGDYPAAARLLKAHLTDHPNDLAAVRDLGLVSYQVGQYQQAINLLYPLLRTDPADHQMLAAYGLALKGVGRHTDAASVLEKALVHRDSPQLRAALAEAIQLARHGTDTGRQNNTRPRTPTAGHDRPLADDLDTRAINSKSPSEAAAPMRGRALFTWHRRITSFGRFWVGLVLIGVAAGIAIAGLPAKLASGDAYGTHVHHPATTGLLIMAGVGIALLVHAALSTILTRYRVYERRIDFECGILFQRRNPIWLYDITDLSLTRSPLLILTGTAAIELRYDTAKKGAGSERLVAVRSSARMREFLEQIQENVLRERRAMKKIWI